MTYPWMKERALAMESIYLVSEEKTGTRHIKMAMISNEDKIMRKIEDQEIEKYAAHLKGSADSGWIVSYSICYETSEIY